MEALVKCVVEQEDIDPPSVDSTSRIRRSDHNAGSRGLLHPQTSSMHPTATNQSLACQSRDGEEEATSLRQQRLLLLPLLRLYLLELLLARIKPAGNLVERIVGMLLEFLANLIDFLLPSQALLVLHLVQPAFLESGVRSLEPSFRMSVDLVLVVVRKRKRI